MYLFLLLCRYGDVLVVLPILLFLSVVVHDCSHTPPVYEDVTTVPWTLDVP